MRRFRVLFALAYNDPLYYQGITQYANQADWELDLTVSYYGSMPAHWNGDGIITHYLRTRPDLMDWIRCQTVPVVSINADEISDWPGIAPDHHRCGQMAAEFFYSLGIRNFAFFRCSDQISIQGRQDAFRETVENRGSKFFLIDWRDTISEKRSTEELSATISQLPLPLGVFCQSDHRAASLFNACEVAGRVVPDDIAILGVGNNETLCQFSRVPLSSIDTDMHRIAWEGAKMLDDLMLDRLTGSQSALPELRIIPPIGLVNRKSTAVFQAENPKVAKALLFIMTHSTEMINANDVIKHVGASRDWLNRLFKNYVGRSISDELLRVRLEHAKHLLLGSDKKIADIARETGFTSYNHFAKSFQRSVGCSAGEFIRQT